MDNRRDAVLEHARQRGAFTPADEARAVAARDEYRRFGADLHVADVLASAGKIPAEEMEAASRGEEIPSRIANLDVVRLAGGTPERPVLLARRAIDGETFLVHACMRSRGEAPPVSSPREIMSAISGSSSVRRMRFATVERSRPMRFARSAWEIPNRSERSFNARPRSMGFRSSR